MRGGERSALAALGSLSVACAVVAGCGHGHSAVRLRAASDFGCPPERVDVRLVSGRAFRARGCGSTATYVCFDAGCVLNSDISGSGAPSAEDAVSTQARARAILRSHVARMEACNTTGDVVTVSIRFGPNGRLAYVLAGENVALRQCLEEVLATSEVGASGRTVGFSVHVAPAPPSAPLPPGGAPVIAIATAPDAGPAIANGPPDAVIRAMIDAQAASIVACLGRGPVAVEVTYDAAGALSVSLRGAQHGTPDEGCVRALLRDARIAAPGSAGVVVHVAR